MDYFPGEPFILELHSKTFPDSLGGKNVKGFIAIILKIDSKCKILKHDIAKIELIDSVDNKHIHFNMVDDNKVKLEDGLIKWINKCVTRIKIKNNPKFDKKYSQRYYNVSFKISLP